MNLAADPGRARRAGLRDRMDRALLTLMMVSIAFVLEKVLDRMVEGKPARRDTGVGRSLFRRIVSEAAHLQHRRDESLTDPNGLPRS